MLGACFHIIVRSKLSILSYVQDQEIESLAAIESELENAAQKLHELRRGWERDWRNVDSASSSSSSPSPAVFECVARYCLSLFFFFLEFASRHHAVAASLVTFYPSYRLTYIRCKIQVDLHTRIMQIQRSVHWNIFAYKRRSNATKWKITFRPLFFWQSLLSLLKCFNSFMFVSLKQLTDIHTHWQGEAVQ